MITTPTLFVLGAGASHPYGFPTGDELRRSICRNLDTDTAIQTTLLSNGFSGEALREFVGQFSMSGGVSIDTFLAYRPQFEEIGKLAIAGSLLPRERYLALGAANESPGDTDWYGYLWKLMIDDIKTFRDLSKNRVSFITFNYDRSLENFLLLSTQTLFGVPTQSAREVVAQIPIHHMYGSLGHPFVYGPSESYEEYADAAAAIHVVPTARPASDPVAYKMLRASDNVMFLGFGFDRINCLRLGVEEVTALRFGSSITTHYSGTGFGLTDQEAHIAKTRVAGGNHHRVVLRGETCLQFLRGAVGYLV